MWQQNNKVCANLIHILKVKTFTIITHVGGVQKLTDLQYVSGGLTARCGQCMESICMHHLKDGYIRLRWVLLSIG